LDGFLVLKLNIANAFGSQADPVLDDLGLGNGTDLFEKLLELLGGRRAASC